MRLWRQGESLFVETPAKINLSLAVLGKREDGYHELETVMLSVGVHDTLAFSAADVGVVQLACHSCSQYSSEIPSDDRNLVVTAARLMMQEFHPHSGTSISLWKRIPSEAGLGGGSSDAAAAIVALNRLWELSLTSEELHGVAARLGSDVNFFLDSHPAALCRGRGEEISPIEVSHPLPIVLVKPETGLSTGSVFKQWGSKPRESKSEFASDVCAFLRQGGMAGIARGVFNDLQAAARELNPQIDELLGQLEKEQVIAAGMTGSGSVCFAVCHTLRAARSLAHRYQADGRYGVLVALSGV
ncbi:4-(cytidine 5'-diphospho)-2-C-methyl-D-erythritol kinase [Planctomicrobium sp. SH668]|uniref:4-(cytidine 5'-diphospho)-2-C-methyl-D-erythritol kinase n=1 Tax=Planctomicrobium sp. SH668 TaxID=3448126 RepID=UPI003F5CA72F